jgi:hypothetical protein
VGQIARQVDLAVKDAHLVGKGLDLFGRKTSVRRFLQARFAHRFELSFDGVVGGKAVDRGVDAVESGLSLATFDVLHALHGETM